MRSENPERKSIEADIKELSDAIKEIEGPGALKIELMEHIQVVVQGNNHIPVRRTDDGRYASIYTPSSGI